MGQDTSLSNAKAAQSYLPELNEPQRVESKLTICLKVTEPWGLTASACKGQDLVCHHDCWLNRLSKIVGLIEAITFGESD